MTLPDGVFFGLPEDEYHALPRLSSSGIRWLMVSPMDFWARSWMNPDPPADDDTAFKKLGRAYHCRICEGREAFEERYAAALDPADHPKALRTVPEMKEELRARELKLGGNKDDLVQRLLDDDPKIEIWDVLVDHHAEAHAGKVLLPGDRLAKIEIAAAMIEKHPDLSRCFKGGQPEVTVLWTDDGVPMKAKLDYLKPQAIVDLKSFSNPLSKPIDRALVQAIAGGRYYVQAAIYFDAADRAVEFARDGQVHGDVPGAFLEELVAANDRQFVFVFQQTGVAPVARGKVFPRGLVYDLGKIAARQARDTFKACMETFGTDPWVDTTPLGAFEDSEFPAWTGE